MSRMEPISLLDLPSARKRRTCRSRGLGQFTSGSVSFGASGEDRVSASESAEGRAEENADSNAGLEFIYNACRTRAAPNCVAEVWKRMDKEFLSSATERFTSSNVRVEVSENSSSRTAGRRSTWERNLSLRRESFNSTQRPLVTSQKVVATKRTFPHSSVIG